MKCLMKTKSAPGYEYKDIEIPDPKEGELLVKVLKVSICGSDIALYTWNDVAKVIASPPFIPGHECVGEVLRIGSNCPPEYQIGSKICCENHFFCGECYQCNHNEPHICQYLNQYGHGKGTMHGGFSQYSIIPARYAYLLKTDLAVELACLLEPFGVSHQAVEKLKPLNETVLIQGCGPIGLYAIGLCKYFRSSKIIATDIVDSRLELAKKMGAQVVVNGKSEDLFQRVQEETDNNGVGCLLEASGAQPLVNHSFKHLRKGGTMVMVGIPKAPLFVENVAKDVLFKSLSLHTIHGRKIFSTWEECEKILKNNCVDITCTISHRFPMSQYEDAFKTLMSGECCKILVDPQM